MKTVRLLGMLALLLFAAHSAMAATYYCTPSGSGSGSGADWSNACNFNGTTPARGNTYYIAGGAYSGRTWSMGGTGVITIKKATEADHGPSTGWVSSYGTNQAAFGSAGSIGMNFQTGDFYIDGQTGGGPSGWESNLGIKLNKVYITNASNITLRHADIDANRTAPENNSNNCNNARPLYSNNVNGLTLSYCYIHNAADDVWTMVGTTANILVEYSKWAYAYQSAACHPDLAQGYGGSYSDITWRHNFIYALKVTYLWGVHDNFTANNYEIYGNLIVFTPPSVFDSSTSDGIVGDLNAKGKINNLKFYNNTIAGDWSYNIGFGTVGIVGTGNAAYNNLWVKLSSSGSGGYGSISSVTHSNNSSYNTTGPGETNRTGNPFTNSASNDYTLSTATDAGVALESPYNVDMYGNIRGADGVWDRGAVEFNSSAVARRPSAPPSLSIQ